MLYQEEVNSLAVHIQSVPGDRANGPGDMAQEEVTLMSKAKPKRRSALGGKDQNIYKRYDGLYEVGYRDTTGKQRWDGPHATLTAARNRRDTIKGEKASGKHVEPNPNLRFGDAADLYLRNHVCDLRETTQNSYRNSIETHLRPRWGRRKLVTLKAEDARKLVRELREEGKAEWTIATIVRCASAVFSHVQREEVWHGSNPMTKLSNGSRPEPSKTQRRRIFTSAELAATLAAAHEPFRLLFMLAAVSGARESELLGLTWADVDLSDVDAAEVRFSHQASRKGERVALKTQESRRTVELPRQLAVLLAEHRAASLHSKPDAFVFATRSGRPIGQRNVLRELRRAMTKATDERGRLVFPILSERDEHGKPVKVPRGSVPNFHSFRHTAASEAIAAGESVEEVSWQLGHRNSVVTRTVYVQEVKSAERTARRRSKMEARLGSLLEATDRHRPQQRAGEVVPIAAARSVSQ